MPTPTDSQIRSRIDSFLAEMTALVRQSALEAVREALGNGEAPARRGPGRPRGSRNKATGSRRKKAARRASSAGGKRSPEYLDKVGEGVLSYVRAHPGHGSEAIGRALGLSSKDRALPIRKLIAEKKLRTEGQRRGTRYVAGGGGGGGAPARRSKGARNSKAGRNDARKDGRKSPRKAARASARSTPAEATAAA